jgi:predicted DNA-binding protein with PD1-like motif
MALKKKLPTGSAMRVQAINASHGKQVLARLLPGTDLIAGIEQICAQQGIIQAAVLSAIGTLSHATIVYVVPQKDAALGVAYVPPQRLDGPFELLAAQGFVGMDTDDSISVHLHGSLSGPDMTVYGGHFIKGGNPVLATAEIMIQELSGVAMNRGYDKETGFELFQFSPKAK